MMSKVQIYNLQHTWPHYLKFKVVVQPNGRRHRVKGGRWQVRRLPDEIHLPYFRPSYTPKAGPWRAWTHGKAQKWNKWFKTQDEAMSYAQTVAMLYRKLPHEQITKSVIQLALINRGLDAKVES